MAMQNNKDFINAIMDSQVNMVITTNGEEIKQANNSRFWDGLETQLVKYLEVEKDRNGIFIAVCYTESDIKKVSGIEHKVRVINKKLGLNISVIVIDATPDKPSASKL